MPEYPGGREGILKYFSLNYKYPNQNDFQGSIDMEFVIDIDGNVTGARIKNKDKAEITLAEQKALEVLRNMPRWKPGRCNNIKVPVRMIIPLRF